MSFSPGQQGKYRPMRDRAWQKHAEREGLNPGDRKAKDTWYRAELVECIGVDTTTHCNQGRDFETVMAHFEEIIGEDFFWNLRVHQGDTRRLQWSIARICEKWQIDDAYARATAVRVLKWQGHLTSLAEITDPADLQRVRIALLKHARRNGLREDQAAAQAQLAANPALNVPPDPAQAGRLDHALPNATTLSFQSDGVKVRIKGKKEGSKMLRRMMVDAGLAKRPLAKRPARQANPTKATIDPDNCPF
ncbi:MAG: hypothetical protein PHQ12_03545 [Chthoniobacteraceae bacterium]|nr:hypothetical protein [Chthoniobacteraceae bacterium]